MPARPQPVPVDLTGRTLLLGDAGDVVLLDLRGARPADAATRVGEAAGRRPVGVRVSDPALVPVAVDAGAQLVHVAASLGATAEVRAAALDGVAVVLAGDHAPASALGLDLLADGARRGRVVVEVPLTLEVGVVDAEAVRRADSAGLALGAVLLPGPGPVDEVVGWEIGMLAHVMDLGARTVRNVPVTRFHRVLAVVEAVAAARVGRPSAASEPAGSTA